MIVISFFSGLLFGLGLIISGMANPAKVLGFLDLAGKWDPSLMLVMGGAISVGFFAFLYVGRRKTTLRGTKIKLPMAISSGCDNFAQQAFSYLKQALRAGRPGLLTSLSTEFVNNRPPIHFYLPNTCTSTPEYIAGA